MQSDSLTAGEQERKLNEIDRNLKEIGVKK